MTEGSDDYQKNDDYQKSISQSWGESHGMYGEHELDLDGEKNKTPTILSPLDIAFNAMST